MIFVFLSKLIPIFFYPVGLIFLLLVITLVFYYWKKSSLIPYPIALALIILLLSSNGWVSNVIIQNLEWQYLPQGELPKAEAIVLLGGATRSGVKPRPMVDVNDRGDRILYTAKLYHEGKAPIIIASGGRIKWLGGGQPESEDMTRLLELMGVPRLDIIQEPNSLNTYQNAINVKEILLEKNINQILLVTSAFHMPRAVSIFKKLGINPIPAPTDFLVSEKELMAINSSLESIILNFLPDAHRISKTTLAIKEYIGTIVYRLRGWL